MVKGGGLLQPAMLAASAIKTTNNCKLSQLSLAFTFASRTEVVVSIPWFFIAIWSAG
jgi:hypothetical protein